MKCMALTPFSRLAAYTLGLAALVFAFLAPMTPTANAEAASHPCNSSGQIAVKVTDTDSGEPIEGITVYALWHDGIGTSIYARTDADGIVCLLVPADEPFLYVAHDFDERGERMPLFRRYYENGYLATDAEPVIRPSEGELQIELSVGLVTQQFEDVPRPHWLFREITWLALTGVSTGYSADNTFRPQAPVERQAIAAFYYRLAGTPDFDPPSTSPFDDVPTDHRFYTEITWLASTGITSGFADGTFRPRAHTQRQAAVAFAYRYAQLYGWDPVGPPASPRVFTDVPLDHQFADEIYWARERGLTVGYTADNTFRPTNATDRQATARFLARVYVGRILED